MNCEQKANTAEPEASETTRRLHDVSFEEPAQAVRRPSAEPESDEPEEPELEEVRWTDEQMEALSDQQLQEQIDLLEEQQELTRRQKELDRRAFKLGLLRMADKAPRCNHVKASGKPCRAPAAGGRLFCVYHGRALDTQNGPRMDVKLLEDRESLQLTVKQIMEQVVAGRLDAQTASLLLRGVQVANSTLKPKVRIARRRPKSTGDERSGALGNAEEISA
jgi:hypothetical protein